MKTLYLIRHAKSSWGSSANSDFDRPLNERGKSDAQAIGEFLKSKSVLPGEFLTSSAYRAHSTSKILAKEIGFDVDQLLPDRRLYMCDINHMQSIMREFSDDWDQVAVVGHNPTMTDCVNALADEELENLPTCGVFAVELNIDSWRKLRNGVGTTKFFITPKTL